MTARVIHAGPRDVISVRVAEPDECRELGLPLWQGRLIFVFTSPDGNEALHPADGVTVMLKSPDPRDSGARQAEHMVPVS